MAEEKPRRLSQVAKRLNVGITTIVEHLAANGYEVESKPNARITPEQFNVLAKEFESSVLDREEASGLTIGGKRAENMIIDSGGEPSKGGDEEEEVFIKGYSSYSSKEDQEKEQKETAEQPSEKPEKEKEESTKSQPTETVDKDQQQEETSEQKEEEQEEPETNNLQGIKVVGKIDLEGSKKKKAKSQTSSKEAPSKKSETTVKSKVPKEEPTTTEPSATEETKKEEPTKTEEQEVKAPAPEKETTKKASKEKKKEEAQLEEDTSQQSQEEQAETENKEESTHQKEETIGQTTTDQQETLEQEEEQKIPEPAAEETGEAETGEEEEETEQPQTQDTIGAKADQLKGLTVLGKIDLPEKSKKNVKPVASSDEQQKKKKKRPRRRITAQQEAQQQQEGSKETQQKKAEAPKKEKAKPQKGKAKKQKAVPKREEISDKEIQEQIKDTLSKLSSGGKSKIARGSKNRYDKRKQLAKEEEEKMIREQEEAKKLKVTEFISANDLASLMDVSVNEVISVCMGLGMFISINQRLDAETITVIADEFGYDVDFTTSEDELEVEEEEEKEVDQEERAPIVTIMGHVDHGKTSLLDYIRNAKVTSGEAGGITQHIGAYDVTTDSGKRIAFLDTPGHEAFTAMRARGAKVTDVVIIVVAADDNVMPQTKEAINHALVAGVPIVIAINKVDKPNADPNKVREELANINILVEDWGGKYQVQEISAKTGKGIDDLLEKVLLESEILELKADPNKKAVGTVIESTLDRGRGYLTTLLVQSGTLKVGDVILAGPYYGRVKAMFDHRGQKVNNIGPSTPVQMLGLNGAPQAGDRFNVMEAEREARDIANKREQIQREQSLRTKKHITLDEIGRRLAIGSFKELNIIIKGDVDGSVEALSDSLLKLSTEEIQVNIIHKGVGQISESDVLLASASDAIIVGFQVRPSSSARQVAEREEIEIRLYSVIYDAINDVKDAMEGMLAPKVEEVITGNIEVREVFKISKVGRVAGCYVTDGVIKRNNKIRLVRDGIVAYTGDIDTLKRFKEDVNEVKAGYECGLSIKNYNDIQEGDVIEGFEEKEVKRYLGQQQPQEK